MLHVVDNFFEDFEFLKDAFKNIKLYDLKSYNEKFKTNDCWPGLRSQELFDYHPFLAFYFLKHFREKFSMIDYKKYTFHLYIHLRLGSDQQKDWVHTDKSKYSFLTYLSDTNYKSGTILYDKINDGFYPHTEINFKQNRALLFKASEYHCSKFNHGDNIHNGRLTLNAFLY